MTFGIDCEQLLSARKNLAALEVIAIQRDINMLSSNQWQLYQSSQRPKFILQEQKALPHNARLIRANPPYYRSGEHAHMSCFFNPINPPEGTKLELTVKKRCLALAQV